ncbi:MAG: radical SAM protein [Kiritimatiellia bacterium]
MKIVVINPQASPKMPFDGPPLGILAAVSLVDEKKHQITVLDWHYKNYEDRIREACRKADLCGITSLTGYQIGEMLKAARIAREANPNIKIVCGGCHPTLMPDQTLDSDLIDIVVIGQGQRTFAELVDVMESGRPLDSVKGIGFKHDGVKVLTEERPLEDINNFPMLPYHLLEGFENYLVQTSFAKKTMYYLSSEGCPGKCKFCAEESLYHRRWIGLKPERMVRELRWLKDKYEFDGVAIADSNFYVHEKRVVEFCNMMMDLGLTWGGTSGRPDRLKHFSDETFALMKKSGLHEIFLGVESGSDEVLDLMDKGCFVQDSLEVIPRLAKYGIHVLCSFIIGVPGVDVKKDFKSTMRFINKLRKTGWVSKFHLFVYTPLPGTRFLPEAQALGYVMPKTLEDWTRYEFHAHTTPWIPKKYAQYTDAASIYFMFLGGYARTVVKAVVPKKLLWLGLLAERAMYWLSRFRISTVCFVFPLEYHVIKWVLLHKDRFFGDKKLLF